MKSYVVQTVKSKRLVGQFAKRFNAKFTRKNDKRCIKAHHVTLIHKLIDCLAVQLKRLNEAGLPVDTYNALSLNHFNAYYANTEEGEIDKTPRTINNYMRFLASAGAIQYQKVANRSLILIHPDLIRFVDRLEVLISCSLCRFFGLQPRELKKTERSEIQPLFLRGAENFSDKYSTGTIKKQLDSVVDKPQHDNTAQGQPIPEGNTAQGTPSQPLLEARKAAGKNGESQAPRPKNLRENANLRRAAVAETRRREGRTSAVNRMVVFLWSFVIEHFYRPAYPHFAESQEEIVRRFFEDQFLTVPDQRLEEVYRSLNDRNRRWLKFLKKDPTRFTPLPGKFFDLNNSMGYQRTKTWQEADKKTAKKYTAQNEIDYRLRVAKKLLTGNQTYKGRTLTGKERIHYLDQLADQVQQIANHHNRPELVLTYQRKLEEFIEQNQERLTGIN